MLRTSFKRNVFLMFPESVLICIDHVHASNFELGLAVSLQYIWLISIVLLSSLCLCPPNMPLSAPYTCTFILTEYLWCHQDLDTCTCSIKDLQFSQDFILTASGDGQVNAIVGYFDIFFHKGCSKKVLHFDKDRFLFITFLSFVTVVFTSPELNAQVSFSARLLFAVCLSVSLSVRPSVCL